MFKPLDTRAARQRRHRRIRVALRGTGQRPRLNVFRSLHHIYAQVIDDATGTTLAAASTNEPDSRGSASGTKVDRARLPEGTSQTCAARPFTETAMRRPLLAIVYCSNNHAPCRLN